MAHFKKKKKKRKITVVFIEQKNAENFFPFIFKNMVIMEIDILSPYYFEEVKKKVNEDISYWLKTITTLVACHSYEIVLKSLSIELQSRRSVYIHAEISGGGKMISYFK